MEKIIVVFTYNERHESFDFVGVNQLGEKIVEGQFWRDEIKEYTWTAVVNYGDKYGEEISVYAKNLSDLERTRKILSIVDYIEVINTVEL